MNDESERWLIQKDGLDFGPFKLSEIQSQIESGKLSGENFIIDTETSERKRLRDQPQLRALVIDSDQKQAERQREDAEVADRQQTRRRVVSLLLGIFAIVIVGGGFAFWYVSHMQPKVVKEVVHDGGDLDFLRNLQISMKVDPPVKHATTRHPRKNGKPGEFDEVTNLGDASASGGDETLDQSVVQRVMSQNFRVLVGCIQEERRRAPGLHEIDMDFIIRGTGQVSAVKVNGDPQSALSSCMYGKMQAVSFPKFNGSKTHASFTLALK